jgi:DNA-binding response OmpR family regulator
MHRMPRLLVVEDDAAIAAPLVRALRREGYEVDAVERGADAVEHAETTVYDLVLLDLGLPDADGVDVCRRLRATRPQLPIVMVTARQEELDAVVGLDAGADDYVTKPFRLAELLARVRARLRAAPETETVLTAQDVRVDLGARRAWRGDEELDLTNKEFELLALLVREVGHVVTRERIMEEVWDEHWFGSTKTLDVHVSWLRRKLGDDPANLRYITTVRGVGLRFERGANPAGRTADSEPSS